MQGVSLLRQNLPTCRTNSDVRKIQSLRSLFIRNVRHQIHYRESGHRKDGCNKKAYQS